MNPENTREAKIKKLFLQNPDLDELYVTSDEFAFSKRIHADNHANSLKDKTVEAYKRNVEDKGAETDFLKLNIKDFIVKVQEVKNIDELTALLDQETLGKKRKGILSAITERINAIAFDPNNPLETQAD